MGIILKGLQKNYFKRRIIPIFEFTEKILHYPVKPLSLCEYIINLTTYSNEAVVLDPFAGSGTTLVAAKKSGRKFIGIDITKEYIEIAKTRIKSSEVDFVRYNIVGAEKQLRIFEKKISYKKSSKVKIAKAV